MPVATVGQGDSPQEWYNSLPIITKVLFTSTFGLTALASLGLLNPHNLVYSWELVKNNYQIWRFFSGAVFAGGFSFNFLMHLYMLYQISLAYESSPYNTGGGGTSADYLYMLLIGIFSLCAVDAFNPIAMHDAVLYYIMYVRSRRSPDDIMSLWGFKFKALYMPWVYLAFRLLTGGSLMSALMGVVVGHIFYFFVEVLPSSYGYNIIKTPALCNQIIAYTTGRSVGPSSSTFSTSSANNSTTSSSSSSSTGGNVRFRPSAGGVSSYNWGRGQALGST